MRQLRFLYLAVLFASSLSAQETFSNRFTTGLIINPAFTGFYEAPTLSLSFQNQWPEWQTNYSAGFVSFDKISNTIPNSAVGLSYFGAFLGGGITREQKINFYYAYKKEINTESDLKIGVNAGIRDHFTDLGRLTFSNTIDQNTVSLVEESPQHRNVKGELGLGIIYRRKKFLVGCSAYNIPVFKATSENRDVLNLVSANAEFITNNFDRELAFEDVDDFICNVHGAFTQTLNEKIQVGIEALVMYNSFGLLSRSSVQANISSLVLGAVHSGRNTVGGIIGVKKDQFKLAYSFLVAYPLGAFSLTTHEINFSCNFTKSKSQKSMLFRWNFI